MIFLFTTMFLLALHVIFIVLNILINGAVGLFGAANIVMEDPPWETQVKAPLNNGFWEPSAITEISRDKKYKLIDMKQGTVLRSYDDYETAVREIKKYRKLNKNSMVMLKNK